MYIYIYIYTCVTYNVYSKNIDMSADARKSHQGAWLGGAMRKHAHRPASRVPTALLSELHR